RLRVFADHGIDFQQGSTKTCSPDITLLDGEPLEWSAQRGAMFPVVEMQSRVVFIIELTSKSTRRTDLHRKPPFYFQGGVPLYIIADLPYGGSKKPLGLLVQKAGPSRYNPMSLDANGRYWLDVVNLWLGVENGRIACYDKQGVRIGDYTEVSARADHAESQAA